MPSPVRITLVLLSLAGAFACSGKSRSGPSGVDGGAPFDGGGSTAGAGGAGAGGSAGSTSQSGGAGGSGNVNGSGGDGSGGMMSATGGAGENGIGGDTASAGEPATAGNGSGTGGSPDTGGSPSLGGAGTGGADTGGAGTGGGGTGGEAQSTPPCDIYAAANVPCVGAYSMVRVLSSTYSGPLYQVRKGGPNPNYGEGGETRDIVATADGFGHAAAQDSFCGDEPCTVSVLYDQSGKENHLRAGADSCYDATASDRASEADAKRHRLSVRGHDVYALFTQKGNGYRNNDAVDTPEGEEEQGVYAVADGTQAGEACCWDFGTGSRDNCYGATGSANTLFLGIGYWGRGEGSGPWFMADLEAGVWAGGTEASSYVNPDNPSMALPYAFGIMKTGPQNYTLRMGDATAGNLTTAWNGGIPMGNWVMEGGIILGIGSDVSNSSQGVLYEGVITAGRPSDETDEAVYRSVQAVGYGR